MTAVQRVLEVTEKGELTHIRYVPVPSCEDGYIPAPGHTLHLPLRHMWARIQARMAERGLGFPTPDVSPVPVLEDVPEVAMYVFENMKTSAAHTHTPVPAHALVCSAGASGARAGESWLRRPSQGAVPGVSGGGVAKRKSGRPSKQQKLRDTDALALAALEMGGALDHASEDRCGVQQALAQRGTVAPPMPSTQPPPAMRAMKQSADLFARSGKINNASGKVSYYAAAGAPPPGELPWDELRHSEAEAVGLESSIQSSYLDQLSVMLGGEVTPARLSEMGDAVGCEDEMTGMVYADGLGPPIFARNEWVNAGGDAQLMDPVMSDDDLAMTMRFEDELSPLPAVARVLPFKSDLTALPCALSSYHRATTGRMWEGDEYHMGCS